MPVYEYRCLDCDVKFDVVETFAEHEEHEPGEATCPKCGNDNVERVWSRVVAVTSKKS